MAIAQRLQRLRQRLSDREFDGIIITQPENCRYICQFTGSSGSVATLLVSQNTAILATDFIHFEQAKQEANGCEIVLARNPAHGFAALLSGQKLDRLAIEANSLCFADYRRLSEEADRVQSDIVPTEGIVESLRAVKDEQELACLQKAAELADSAVRHIVAEIRPGMTEKEAAWEIEKYLRESTSEPIPFDIIVASGPNAALPHAKPTSRPISTSEPIIMDLGARVNGYSSDMSRTLCLGRQNDTFIEIYNLVLQAQRSVVDNFEAGMTGAQVDSLARAIIDGGGYKDAFGHGLGHGLGLAVHEEPRLGPNSSSTILDNMVFTVEPAVYLNGWGGVRIEDMVLVDKGKARILTKAPKSASM